MFHRPTARFREILRWDGSNWINNTLAEAGIAATGHNHTLDSLSNVTITGNSTGEILKWNGSAWVNNTLAEAGIAADSHTHSAFDRATSVLSGAVVFSDIIVLDGITTGISTRTLTLADLGYTGATDANNYSHPNHTGDVTSVGDGATTIANDAVTYAQSQTRPFNRPFRTEKGVKYLVHMVEVYAGPFI